jgi:putative transposase
LTPFLEYPTELGKMMYTTNTIENHNLSIRKYTKTKVQCPDEKRVKKSGYLAIQNSQLGGQGCIPNCGLVMNQFLVIFDKNYKI